MKLPIAFLFLFHLVCVASGYKILAIFAFSSKSHLFSFLPLAHELSSRGHDLTLIHSQPKLTLPSTIKSISLLELQKSMNDFSQYLVSNRKSGLTFILSNLKQTLKESCTKLLQSQETQALMKAGKQFDLVIVMNFMNDCGIAIAPLLGKHLILHQPIAFFLTHPSPAPSPPSIVPNPMFYFPSKMTFKQRFINFVGTLLLQGLHKYYFISELQTFLKELAPGAPTILEAMNSASLTIVNQDVIISSPRPLVPNVIAAPGMPCVPPKPLPQDLEQFMQTSGDDGVVVVGLGSIAQSIMLSQEITQKLLTVFGKLKPKVIWKYENESLVVPPNVKAIKWLPQQDLLGHPKTKLFISHGGLASMQEAVYHGVPVVGIALFGDQFGNVARMKEIGAGDYVDVDEVTADELYHTITNILNDQSYYDRMKKFSALFKDNLQPSVKKAAFWVEYVARYNGAKHLRTVGQDMCLFQYFLVDVIAFLMLISLLSLYLVYRIVKLIWRKRITCQWKKTDTKKTQ